MTLADVDGIAPGVSAHVNRCGYLPAAPVAAPGRTHRLFVLWLDDAELDALDATEPNYRGRCRWTATPSRSCPVRGSRPAPSTSAGTAAWWTARDGRGG
ncbi:hypothetical protein [Nocardiopsis sp. CNR-923]|uniref:hypothetical protein n=1 Tax=Nocardiopsis sp. CNR-923 TaxID=1904965 RepID=UPI001180A002|nr:hypothetical protein [Nocardiopsis sp. CNR-923]